MHLKPVNEAIIHCENEIALIQEYRTRLICDVVTGKIDVRDIEVPDLLEGETTEEISDSEEYEEIDEADKTDIER